MSECEGNCGEHSSLATDVKWMQRGMYFGMGILLSAIVYFNQSLQGAVIQTQKSTMEVHQLLTESRAEHRLELAQMSNRQDSFELLCCEEISGKIKGKL